MIAKRVVEGVHRIPLGGVNVFLVDGDDGTGAVLVDAGLARTADRVVEALAELGLPPREVTDILITHAHGDHAGGLAELVRHTGAVVWAHKREARLIETGLTHGASTIEGTNPVTSVVARFVIAHAAAEIEPVAVGHLVQDGEVIPVAGGVEVVGVPGHTRGSVAYLLPRHGGVLFVGDAAGNTVRLRLSMNYEDMGEGRRSLEQLASRDFEVACFAHGRPLKRHAAKRFRRHWGSTG
jgi:glyoxylase-like metal-dependent hydrolase (beta-lactamase superfamily II)